MIAHAECLLWPLPDIVSPSWSLQGFRTPWARPSSLGSLVQWRRNSNPHCGGGADIMGAARMLAEVPQSVRLTLSWQSRALLAESLILLFSGLVMH
eukprot:5166796-Amphidinium_carterae.2